MASFEGGPLGSFELGIWRAPVFVRVVVDASGRRDVLNLLVDEPTDDERVYVYRADGPCGGLLGAVQARYQHLGLNRFQEESLRANEAWRAWVRARPDKPFHSIDEDPRDETLVGASTPRAENDTTTEG